MQAIAAGCDGVLVCSGDHDRAGGGARGAGHAVEDGRSRQRVEDALARQRRAKERFLAAARSRAAAGAALRAACSAATSIGAIADEMARYLCEPARSQRAAQTRRSHRRRLSRQPVQPRGVRRGVDELRRLGFEPSTTRRVRAAARTFRTAAAARRGVLTRLADPSIAR